MDDKLEQLENIPLISLTFWVFKQDGNEIDDKLEQLENI